MPDFSKFDGSAQGDYLSVVKHLETGKWQGVYFMSKPLWTGKQNFVAMWSTSQTYDTQEQAQAAIETLFPAMPKIKEVQNV
ncbi:hypothetical protein QNI19_14665 [Cytophagaceae bacterium DM2B3-1]|uniref:Uncharacterized protein n=1 Tax=Xanthocytophaga flava TaxID=3048013 RepID=A0ABT7CKC2_9BACT|nr:hypothetical protein [Xanthocytophaga flavus]MDJ1494183.1 hypothetical protein [Xanthocytophaga flavus]